MGGDRTWIVFGSSVRYHRPLSSPGESSLMLKTISTTTSVFCKSKKAAGRIMPRGWPDDFNSALAEQSLL